MFIVHRINNSNMTASMIYYQKIGLFFVSLCFCNVLLFSPSTEITQAAQVLLAGLEMQQKKDITFEMESDQREIWHYLPEASFDRFGLSLKELTEEQDHLVFALLEASLSEVGFSKAKQIIMLENVLQVMEKNTVFRDPEQYHIAIYGKPGDTEPWGWGFSGHHLSL